MKPETSTTRLDEETARREFLKKIGKAAASAPAVALLLAASSKPASAQAIYPTTPDGGTPGD